MLVKKSLKAIQVSDYDGFTFSVLEGTCGKCGVGPYSLIMYELRINKKVSSQSTFKTVCIACGDRHTNFISSVEH